jgi:hypothetical protein
MIQFFIRADVEAFPSRGNGRINPVRLTHHRQVIHMYGDCPNELVVFELKIKSWVVL